MLGGDDMGSGMGLWFEDWAFGIGHRRLGFGFGRGGGLASSGAHSYVLHSGHEEGRRALEIDDKASTPPLDSSRTPRRPRDGNAKTGNYIGIASELGIDGYIRRK